MSNSFFESRRQIIEGAGEVDSGAWQISWFRIAKGWGQLPSAFWPDTHDRVIPPEPANVDAVAKHSRLFHYQRLRTEFECLYAVTSNRPTTVVLEIGKSWKKENAIGGRISLNANDEPHLVHSIGLPFVDLEDGCFPFRNSWGEDWGYRGFGFLPFGYLSRHMVEAWTQPLVSPTTAPAHPGIHMGMREGEDSKLGKTWVFEIYDGDNDVMAGWAFGIRKNVSFDIEEFFVRPDYRRRGLGAELGSELLKLQATLKVPIRFWIPWGDHVDRNAPALLAWASKLGLTLEPAGVRWAAYRAEVGQPLDKLPSLAWIPKKATSPLCALDEEPVATESARSADWTDQLANRRAELVEKKYRSFLTEPEQSELNALQQVFGRYQDGVAPFPPH